MEREENPIHYASRRERLFTLVIFLLILISFFIHLSAFADILLKNIDDVKNQTDVKKNNSKFNELFDVNLLPFFCILAHLIWTIVLMVMLDQCSLIHQKSLYQILIKLFLCTCPLLFCSELSLLLVCHINSIRNDFFIITIKWFIFVGTIFICFWTGILSDREKWRGIHGGQIAPEHTSTIVFI